VLLAVKCCLIVPPPATAAAAAATAPTIAPAAAAVHIDDEYGSFDFNDADLLMMDALEVRLIVLTCISGLLLYLAMVTHASTSNALQ
jgi:hypothetical protein